jgi:hypothetical protein
MEMMELLEDEELLELLGDEEELDTGVLLKLEAVLESGVVTRIEVATVAEELLAA